MLKKRFYISWILCAVGMFALSYILHGMILNDFMRLSIDLNIFLTLSCFVYMLLGFVITFIVANTKRKMHVIKKGLMYGLYVGACVNLISVVFGISFHGGYAAFYQYLFDFAWQVIEQGTGGIISAFVYLMVARFERLRSI